MLENCYFFIFKSLPLSATMHFVIGLSFGLSFIIGLSFLNLKYISNKVN